MKTQQIPRTTTWTRLDSNIIIVGYWGDTDHISLDFVVDAIREYVGSDEAPFNQEEEFEVVITTKRVGSRVASGTRSWRRPRRMNSTQDSSTSRVTSVGAVPV